MSSWRTLNRLTKPFHFNMVYRKWWYFCIPLNAIISLSERQASICECSVSPWTKSWLLHVVFVFCITKSGMGIAIVVDDLAKYTCTTGELVIVPGKTCGEHGGLAERNALHDQNVAGLNPASAGMLHPWARCFIPNCFTTDWVLKWGGE